MSQTHGLTLSEIYTFNTLITDEESVSLESAFDAFCRQFPRKDHFKICQAVNALFRGQQFLPRPTQRLVCLWLLYQSYPNSIESPFAPLYLHLLKQSAAGEGQHGGGKDSNVVVSITSQEKRFLTNLIVMNIKEVNSLYNRKTPLMIMDMEIAAVEGYQLNELEKTVKEIQCGFPETLKAFHNQSPLMPFPDKDTVANDPNYNDKQAFSDTIGEMLRERDDGNPVPGFSTLIPSIIRPPPPKHIAENEVIACLVFSHKQPDQPMLQYIWLHSTELSRFVPLWDDDMFLDDEEPSSSSTSTTAAAISINNPSNSTTSTSFKDKEETGVGDDSDVDTGDPIVMLNKAMTTQLLVNQTTWLCDQINDNPSIIDSVNMCPEKLPSLVEANPLVAVSVILQLITLKDITEYFETLVCMDVTVHGMEVVNRLISHVELPIAFLHLYVSNCISACENMKSGLGQNRLVRLVCVFLQSLIRNKAINIQEELHIELQAFCVNFSRIKEAAALFRFVQNVANDGPSSDSHS